MRVNVACFGVTHHRRPSHTRCRNVGLEDIEFVSPEFFAAFGVPTDDLLLDMNTFIGQGRVVRRAAIQVDAPVEHNRRGPTTGLRLPDDVFVVFERPRVQQIGLARDTVVFRAAPRRPVLSRCRRGHSHHKTNRCENTVR